jgi:hypothetical protein
MHTLHKTHTPYIHTHTHTHIHIHIQEERDAHHASIEHITEIKKRPLLPHMHRKTRWVHL